MPATLSQIQAWSTEHLIDAAAYWTQTADRWEDAFLTMRNQAHAITWHGAGGDALRQRTGADVSVVSGKASQLRQAAGIARNGASDISAAQRRVLYGVEDAQNAGFTVGEDLSVTDTRGTSPAERAARQAQAEAFAADIRSRAEQLEAADAKAAGQLTATAGDVGNATFTPAHNGNGVQLVDFKQDGGPVCDDPDYNDRFFRKFMGRVGAGAAIGGLAGAPEAGVGAIPGAIIGGAAGGIEAFIEGATESEPPKCGK